MRNGRKESESCPWTSPILSRFHISQETLNQSNVSWGMEQERMRGGGRGEGGNSKEGGGDGEREREKAYG